MTSRRSLNPNEPEDYAMDPPVSSGMVWCYVHRREEPEGDVIDFPVADQWRNWYWATGQTPRPAPAFFAATSSLEGGNSRVRELETTVDTLQEDMAKLKETARIQRFGSPRPSPATPSKEPTPKRKGGLDI